MPLAVFQSILDWLQDHPGLLWSIGVLSATMFVGAIFFVPWIIVRIPPDYFSHRRPPQLPWQTMHPLLRVVAIVLKNLLGIVLIVGGIIMIPLPGQGILSTMIGIALLDIPGKRTLERWIIARPSIFKAVNKLRVKYGQPPLEHPHGEEDERVKR